LGSHAITLTVDDGNGGTAADQVVVIVQDSTPPVPDLVPLPTITGECSAQITASPTATDTCTGAITGVTSAPLSYSQPGIFTVDWTFTDGSGNTATQAQTVIVRDEMPPAVTATLAPVDKVKKKQGQFRVQFSCSDSCGADVTTTAMLNGIPVTNGQVVKLALGNKVKAIQKQGVLLKLKAPSFSLVVTCTDASGTVGEATATPPFAS
jgi:hypothetical protein